MAYLLCPYVLLQGLNISLYYCFPSQYAAKDFGTCPLVQCNGQPVLPVGIKDEIATDTVKIFCPKCQQVYHTPPLRSRANISTGVDGAAFGTTFPHLFLMTFSNLVPDPLPATTAYVPRVFGFRVHQTAPRLPEAAAEGVDNNNNQQQPPPAAKGAKSDEDEDEPVVVAAAADNAAGNNSNRSGSGRSKGSKRGRKDETAVAPTFLMENPSKRRKRGTSNT